MVCEQKKGRRGTAAETGGHLQTAASLSAHKANTELQYCISTIKDLFVFFFFGNSNQYVKLEIFRVLGFKCWFEIVFKHQYWF